MVHVAGAVMNPGVYSLPLDSRVQDAVEAAGGLLPQANAAGLNLAASLEDGAQVFVPHAQPEALPEASRSGGAPELVQPSGLPAEGRININTAALDELESLPGIGPHLAQTIIDYRQEHGPFTSVDALLDVKGIGPGILAELKDYITIGLTP